MREGSDHGGNALSLTPGGPWDLGPMVRAALTPQDRGRSWDASNKIIQKLVAKLLQQSRE